MRVTDFFFLSFKYIRSHKARFFVTLTAVTLLFTVLACFTCAYLSGEATFNKCIEEDFAKNGLVCTPFGYDGAREHERLIVALSDFEIKNDGHGNLESQIDNILASLHV